MKRLLCAALCLALLLLAACAAKQAEPPQGVLAFCGAALTAQEVECLTYRYTMDTPQTCETREQAEIARVVEALSAAEVGAPSGLRATDSEQSLTFTLTDGGSVTIQFEGHNLLVDGEAYTLSGDAALWRLASRLRRGEPVTG